MTTESIFRIAFWVLVAGVIVIRIIFTLRVRRAGERVMPDQQAIEHEGRGMFVIRVVLFFLILGWLVIYAIYPGWMELFAIPFPSWLRWVGFILGLASLSFWFWTQLELGKQWSPQLQVREEHHLVTTGPYSRIRHPLYTAMIGYGISIGLITANWVFVILVLAMIVGIFARVPKEEQMMIEEFGDEYQAYMHKTGRFLPN
jgi:protein-S-isoprenylcysteine O-methyltransferase Ste14